jgi:type II secretory pathway component PulF
MSEVSEEYRLLNNVAVMLDFGWDIVTVLKAIRNDVTDTEVARIYDSMLTRLERGDDLGDVLAESELITDTSSRLILRSGQKSGMLLERLGRVAEIVSYSFQGGWDPRRRFLEIFAVMVDSGVTLDDALNALCADFSGQPLGELAEAFLAARKQNDLLYVVALRFPDFFSHQCCELLRYGERRNLARALRSVNDLV